MLSIALLLASSAYASQSCYLPTTAADSAPTLGAAGIALYSSGPTGQGAASLPFGAGGVALSSSSPLYQAASKKEEQKSVLQFAGAGASLPTGLGRMGFQLALQNNELSNRFKASPDSALGYENRDTELAGGLALRVYDEIGFGLGVVYTSGVERIKQWGPSLKIEEQDFSGIALQLSSRVQTGAFTGAFLWQSATTTNTIARVVPNDGGHMGKPYKPAKFSVSLGTETPSLLRNAGWNWFRLRLAAQLDVIHFPGQTQDLLKPGSRIYDPVYSLYVPYAPTASRVPIYVEPKARITPRVGLDATFVETDIFSIAGLGGAYRETSLEGEQILHGTSGVRAALWGIYGAFAIDTADNYRNYLFSAGANYQLN